MSLYMIGLGLGDHKDITIKGAEAIRASDRVFLEMYTSVLGVDVAALVRFGVRRRVFLHGLGQRRSLVEANSLTVGTLWPCWCY